MKWPAEVVQNVRFIDGEIKGMYSIRVFKNEEFGNYGYMYKSLKKNKWFYKDNESFKQCLGTLEQCLNEMQKMADKEKYNNDLGTPIKNS